VRGGDDERQRSYGFRIVSGPGKSGGGSLIFKRPERAGIQYIFSENTSVSTLYTQYNSFII